MDYWPELEYAVNQREIERERSMREHQANWFVEKLEKVLDEKTRLQDCLLPWKYLEPQIEGLAKEWGTLVLSFLRQVSIAYWKLDDENMDRLQLVLLTAPEIENPPQLCWEANKGSQYGLGWFKVKMIIDDQGIPTRFEVLTKKGIVFSANVRLENLK